MPDGDLLAGIEREGETPNEIFSSVDNQSQENPAESLPEKLELPDEVILKKNNAWEEMREAREQAEQKAQELETRLAALETGNIEQPEFLTKMIGENEEVAKDWMKEKATIKEEVKQELIREQIDAQKKEADTKAYWNQWTQDRFGEVEKDFKVSFKSNPTLKNELAKVMNDYTPTDEQGNLDYKKGMKLLTDLKKAQALQEDNRVQVRKNIADATVSNETSVQKNKGFLTSQDLRGKDWRTLVNQD